MADESLIFRILADDQASAGFARAGRSASAASDDVLKLAARLDEVSKKAVTARVGLAGNKEAEAQLDALGLKLLRTGEKVAKPGISLDGAAKASVEIEALDLQLDKLSEKAGKDGATGALDGLAGFGGIPGGGMGALIGAGVLLSPVLVTVGTGLGGLAAAAYGVISPIEKAAQKTGGLQANMHLLNPEQRDLAQSLLGLGQQYAGFEKQLQPEVLGAFGKGIGIVSTLMHDAEPVAAAAGKALNGVLASISADLHDQQWTSFFQWMAANAPEDIRLVSSAVGNLINTLPVLLQDLNPVAQAILGVANAATWLAKVSANMSDGLDAQGRAAQRDSGFLGGLHGVATRVMQDVVTLGGAEVLRAADGLGKVGSAAGGPGAKGLSMLTAAAKPAATAVQLLNADLQQLNGILGNQSAEVTWRQSLDAATKAINGGSKALDGNTSKQLANRLMVIQSTQNLLSLIQSEQKTGGSVNDVARQLQIQIDFLQRAHDKSAWMRQELGLLEKALLNVKSEQVVIHVSGSGSWAVVPGGHTVRTTQPVPPAALGMYISHGTPGVDDQLIRAQRGELVVPTGLVSAGAVDHLRGMIPGFAAGGIVGGYAGSVPGLEKWLMSENKATINSMAAAVAAAVHQAATAPGPSSGGGHTGWNPGAGVAQWGSDVSAALRQLGLPQAYKLDVLYQMMTESGGNPNIVNKWDCVPLSTLILTRRGWLRHDEVRVGDETIGFDHEVGRSRWTRIVRVVHHADAQVARISNKRRSFTATRNHRWIQAVGACSGFVATGDLNTQSRILLSAPADTDSKLDISVAEAAILGWTAGDGSVGDGSPEHRAMSIGQYKAPMIEKLRTLLADFPHSRYCYGHATTFRLTSRYSQDLIARAGHPKNDAVRQVLAMSAEQRRAWLDAIFDAEGTWVGNQRVLYQCAGPVKDAMHLAAYLEGYTTTETVMAGKPQWAPCYAIRICRPVIRGQYLTIADEPGTQDVWCVTTELGSWTAQQDGQTFLTGNSNWLAGHPSVGLMQVIAGTFDTYAGPYRNTGPFSYGVSVDPMANIYAALNYAEHGKGFGTGPGQVGSGHGYDQGGYLPTGWSLAYNGTGKPEPVGPAAGTRNYNITINVGPTAHKREVGREVVAAIVEYERGAGAGWRS